MKQIPSFGKLPNSPLRLLASLLACVAVQIGGASYAAENITINATTVLRSTANKPVGINMNYLVDDEASRPSGSPRTLTQALADAKARYLRFPGGEKSDNYLWTTISSTDGASVTTSSTIPSPLAPRVADPSQWPGNGNYADATTGRFTGPHQDFEEFMTMCRTNGAEPVIVVAYDDAREVTGRTTGPTLSELIASAAAWVKFANVTKGYNIRYWSIGNESWFRSGQTASIYAGHVAQFSSAMRAVDSTIKIGAHGNTSAWFNTVIANASSSIDWLDVHDYPTYNWTSGYNEFRLNNKTLTTDLDKAITSIAAASSTTDQTRLKVGVTEANAIDWATTNPWSNVNDLGHALVTFDMIGQQLSKPKLDFIQLWNTRWTQNLPYAAGNGTNSVVNPGFESDLASWTASSASITTSTVVNGSKALAGASGAYVYQDISFTAGTSGTFSAHAKAASTSIWSGLGVDFYNSSGTKVGGTSKQITSTAFSKYTMLFTTPAGTTTARVWLYIGSGTTGHFDDVALTNRVEPEIYDAFTPDNSYQPVGRALALWGQFLRENLVQGSRSTSVISYASRSTTDDTLAVWLLNKQTASVDVNLTLNNYTPTSSASAWRFAGSGPSDFQPTYTALPAVSVPGSTMSITLPQTSITVLVFSPSTGGHQIISEPFAYPIGTNNADPDVGLNSGNGLPSTNVGGSPSATSTGLRGVWGTTTDVVSGLQYTQGLKTLVTSGGAARVNNATWGGQPFVYRNMATDPFLSRRVGNSPSGNFGVSGTSFYVSFLARTSSSTADAFRLSFKHSWGDNFYVSNTTNGWSLNGTVATGATFAVNTTTLMLLKFDFGATTTNVSLWVNPTLGATASTLGTPNATRTGITFPGFSNFQTNAAVANAMTFDELRVGTTVESVTPHY